MEKTIILEKKGTIAYLIFNRPHAMNSYNLQMGQELLLATEQLLWDQTIRLVVIKGTGPVFMAGGDIHFFKERQDQMPKGVIDMVRLLAAAIHNLQNLEKPVLAVLHGAVAGAGMSFLLAADLAIAHRDTKFTLAYSALGTSPDGGTSYFLPRAVGEKKAMELMLLSEKFSAEQALSWGLVNKISPEETFALDTEKFIHQLNNGPTFAFGKIKQLVYQGRHHSLAEQLELEARFFAEATKTHDFKKGIGAFLNKKIAEFSGH